MHVKSFPRSEFSMFFRLEISHRFPQSASAEEEFSWKILGKLTAEVENFPST